MSNTKYIIEEIGYEICLIKAVIDSWLNQDKGWNFVAVILRVVAGESKIKTGLIILEKKNDATKEVIAIKKEMASLQEKIEAIFQEEEQLRNVFTERRGIFLRLGALEKQFNGILKAGGIQKCDEDFLEEFFLIFTEMARFAYFPGRLAENILFLRWKRAFKLLEEKTRKSNFDTSFMRDYLNNMKEAEFNQKEFWWLE